MEPLNTQSHEYSVFNQACKRRGLLPEGFDVRASSDSSGRTHIQVLLGGREFNYPNASSDPSWAERFFIDIGDEGDAGDGVDVATSEEERGETKDRR